MSLHFPRKLWTLPLGCAVFILATFPLVARPDLAGSSQEREIRRRIVRALSWRVVPTDGRGGGETEEIRQIRVGAAGGLWVLTSRGLGRMGDGIYRNLRGPSALPSEQIFGLTTHAYGIVVATRNGLFALRDIPPPAEQQPLQLVEGLIHAVVSRGDQISYLKRETDGSSLLGQLYLDANGKIRDVQEHVQNTPQRALLSLGQGRVLWQSQTQDWLATLPDHYEAHALAFPGSDDSPDLLASVGDLALSPKGLIRFGASDSGDLVYPFTGGPAQALALGRDDQHFWIAQDGKLLRMTATRGGAIEVEETYAGPPREPDIRALAEDDAGQLWLGTSKGLYMADPVRAHLVNLAPAAKNPRASSMPQQLALKDLPVGHHRVNTMSFAQNGGVWLLKDDGKVIPYDEALQPGQPLVFPGDIYEAKISRPRARKHGHWAYAH